MHDFFTSHSFTYLIYDFDSFYFQSTESPRTKYNMSAPKLEDLPKVADDLKSQLEHFSTDKLKDTVTNEKIVLPTAEGTYASSYHVAELAINNSWWFIRSVHRRSMYIWESCKMLVYANSTITQFCREFEFWEAIESHEPLIYVLFLIQIETHWFTWRHKCVHGLLVHAVNLFFSTWRVNTLVMPIIFN